MIVGIHNDIHFIEAFIAGLQRTMRGLVHVTTEPGHDYTRCSGWVLTDTLVLIPDYAALVPQLYVYPYAKDGLGAEAIPATVLTPFMGKASQGLKPALLQLARPLTDCALTLETGTPSPGDKLIVLQHPEGDVNPQFSQGTLQMVDEQFLSYDASTLSGSGGGPVINIATWSIVGMHTSSIRGTSSSANLNRGLRIDPMLEALRETPVWPDIVKFHNLSSAAYKQSVYMADLSNVRKTSRRSFLVEETAALEADTHLLKAALSWSFDPNSVDETERKELQRLVIDSKAPEWTLKSNERQRILRTAGSPDQLQSLVPAKSPDDAGQKVIQTIVKGAPYNLSDIKEEDLSYWLQAVRWFDGIVPNLPSPAEVNTVLERKRTRGKLENIIRGFRGRKKEIDQLIAWFNDANAGPMLITGIGGMGKSALIGFFVYNLPSDTLLLWLDFDRPDLAPDDAVSVLNAIAKQAAVQAPNFSVPEINEDRWQEAATELGKQLAKATEKTLTPLLILDGFEVAQHTKDYHEIWQVLEVILAEAPRLKVIVSGRAPVKSLKLKGREATPMPLTGMAKEDAEGWLREHKIDKKEVLDPVLRLAEGVPLRLKLAVRLIESGEDLATFADNYPKALIDGYLYQRILYRVIDPLLIPIVKDLLVLRKCSKAMIVELLGNDVPEGLTAEEVYNRLSREMALVGDAENLYSSFVVAAADANQLELRPEVRTATLRLLEKNDAAQVKSMDEKAVGWYKKQNLTDVNNVAELIYHLLRLQRLEEAKKLWRNECQPLLKDAVDDMPEEAHAERGWLEKKVGAETDEPTDNLPAWEIQAALDIKSKLSRGITRDIDVILDSRKQRTPNSPLLIYDAFKCWQKTNLDDAINILQHADEVEGPVQRDRTILHAWLLMQKNDWLGADELLQKVEDEHWWSDRPDGRNEALAVSAARVRVTVDIEEELKLFNMMRGDFPGADKNFEVVRNLRQFLTQSDIVTPLLRDLFASDYVLESVSSDLMAPRTEAELPIFRHQLQQERFANASSSISLEENVQQNIVESWRNKILPVIREAPVEELFRLGFDLAYKGYKRWRYVTSWPLLAKIEDALGNRDGQTDVFSKIFAATLTSLRSVPMRFESLSPLAQLSVLSGTDAIDQSASSKNFELISRYVDLLQKTGGSLIQTKSFLPIDKAGRTGFDATSPHVAVIMYLTSPDPLEILCKRLLNLPETFKLNA